MIWSNIKAFIQHELLKVITLDTLAATSADGESDRATGHSVGPDDPEIPVWLKRRPSFGFAFRAPVGAEILTIRASGLRAYISAFVKGKAPQLDEGEVAVYDASGSVFHLHKDGSVYLSATSGAAVEITADGDVVVTPANGKRVYLACATGSGDPVVTKSELNAKLQLIANHQHPETGTTTGTSTTLAGLSSNGSPSVRAKYP